MKCISCGKEIPAGNVYCPICGKEAQIISDKSVLEDDLLKVLMESEELSEDDIGYHIAYGEELTAEEKERKRNKRLEMQKKKKKQRMILILVIVAICIVAVCVVFGVRKSNSYDGMYEKAEVAYHTEKYEEAIEYAVKALDKKPDSIEVYLLLGDIYLQMDEFDMSKNSYLKVITIDSVNQTAYTKLLQLYDLTEDYEGVRSLYDTVPENEKDILELFDAHLIPVPEVNIKGGEYTEVIDIELSAKKGLDIYYTIDGTAPSSEKEKYEKPFKLDQEGNIVLKAICVDEKGNNSDVLEETYVLEFAIPDKPEVTPDGGEITTATTVSIYVEEGTTAYYTWDDSTPTKSSTKYTEPFEIPEGNNILSVIVFDDITGEQSEVFKTNFIYYPVVDEATII